jgi:hypothetical protein
MGLSGPSLGSLPTQLGSRTTHHKNENSYEHKPVNPGGSGCEEAQ